MQTAIQYKEAVKFLPAVLSGILLIFCFPNIEIPILAWGALVPLLLCLYEKKPKQAFIAGFLFGLPYFFGTLYWVYHSVYHYGGIPFVISMLIVLLFCCCLSIYTGIFSVLFSFSIQKTRLPALLIAPVFWVVTEFLRSYAATGFPWSSLGYTQYRFLSVIQFADITGIYGISFLIVAVNGVLADTVLIRRRLKDMPLFPLSHTVIGIVLLCIITAVVFIYGNWRLGQNRPGHTVRASIIQGNIEQDKKWEPEYQQTVIDIYRKLSLQAVSSSPSLIIWPETSVPFFFGSEQKYTGQLLEFQQGLNAYLLFGSVLIKDNSKDNVLLSNSAVLLDKDGMVSAVYDKIHLVPFGEYIPLKKLLFFLDKLVVGIGDYVQGDQYIRAETPFGGFASIICYEVIFPGLVRKFYTRGGDFIVNLTNDAWFGNTKGPYQHFNMSVFRAIENRKPLIRAANTGISGFIDSNGRILVTTQLFKETVLTGDITTDSTRSFYTKYGDIFSYLCIVFSILLLTDLAGKYRRD